MTSKGVKKEASTPKRESTRTYRKSPARTETSSIIARPTLRKSPSRTTTTKSPVRRSPSRKSPSRRDTIVPEKPKRAARLVSKPVIDIESGSEDSDTNFNAKFTSEKPKATVRGRARKSITETSSSKNPVSAIQDVIPAQEKQTYVGATRRSISKLQAQTIDRIDPIRLESLRPVIQKLTEFSDEDDIKTEVREKSKSRSVSRLIDTKKITTNYGWFASLQILLSTLFMVVYFAFCNKVQCDFRKLPDLPKLLHWSTFFNVISFAIAITYALFVLLLSAISFGYEVSGLPNKQGRLVYLINGFSVAINTIILVVMMECLKVPLVDNIIDKYFQLLMSLLIIGIIVSICLYIKSFYVPLTALKSDVLTNSGFYNFLKGRELNPRLFRVDLKLYFCRLFAVGVIVINGILLYKDIQIGWGQNGLDLKSTKCNFTLVIAAIIQIIYVVDFIIFESTFVTSASAQYDAVGYATAVFYTCGCLVMCAGPKYIYDYGVKLPFWHLAIVFQLFVVGYLLYRMSSNQKHAFRENPYHPSSSSFDTLATSQGKKLLISGFWGWIRHPNYLGHIIVNIAFALLVYNSMPVLIYLAYIVLILQRCQEDGVRCKQRYGFAWDRYCELVKYVLIPKIY